jgi:hypothetical protein
MASPGETLESAWPPLPCAHENNLPISFLNCHTSGESRRRGSGQSVQASSFKDKSKSSMILRFSVGNSCFIVCHSQSWLSGREGKAHPQNKMAENQCRLYRSPTCSSCARFQHRRTAWGVQRGRRQPQVARPASRLPLKRPAHKA